MAFNKNLGNIKVDEKLTKQEGVAMENIQTNKTNIEIKESGVEVLDRLHPKTERRFVSIIGGMKNLWNAMFLLNKDPKYLRFLNRDIPAPVIRDAKRNVIHLPYYWEIISLVALDRVLSDGKVVEAIENMSEEDLNKNVVIMDLIKTGVITRYVENSKFRKLGNIYKEIFKLINENPRPEEVLNCKEKEEYKKRYKEWRLGVKEKYFDKVIESIEGDQLLKGLSDATNEEVKAKYLS